MATLNGQAFLSQQLDSFDTQTHPDWSVWASDDGSTDGTLALLSDYQRRWAANRLHIVQGPRRGVAANFLSMVGRSDIDADYHAFADQDDVWEPGKLARALDHLRQFPATVPAMYCGRTRLIDASGKPVGKSWHFPDPPSFRNALAQNIGGGNTMMLNPAAISLIRQIGFEAPVLLHDWWIYLLVSGAGGHVVYDPEPFVRYRQHASNAVGSNLGIGARITRARNLVRGRLRVWNDQNLASLATVRDLLTEENRRVLDDFCRARSGSLPNRLQYLWRSGVYRQQFTGNVGLVLAALLGRL